jgi:3-hydroxyacyl-[acyl-carrier-protein] dehydratase
MKQLDINRIKALLPHRYPFLLLDRIVDYTPGEVLHAVKNVTINEPFFEGHFPRKPLMPGVLIIEAMAQAAAILGELSGAETPGDDILYYLVGVDNARFRKPVEPGDQLKIEIRFVTVRRNIWKFTGTCRVGDTVVASADFLTTVAVPDS